MTGLPRLEWSNAASESDIEQGSIYPLLTHEAWLSIPPEAIKTKNTLAIALIDKGTHKRRYHPDYMIYADAVPVLIIEAKSPIESVDEGFREAQLYAHEVNKSFLNGVNPASKILACNGIDLLFGSWDSSVPSRLGLSELKPGTDALSRLQAELKWDLLQLDADEIIKRLYPAELHLPYTHLGENRVRLSKIGNNAFSEDLSPLLQKYFESSNPQHEREIVERAYVSSDETTRYERLFENFLRDRVAPLDNTQAQLLEPRKNKEDKLTVKLQDAKKFKDVPGYLQLIIGAVGAGKSTFLKRYIDFLMPDDLKKSSVFVYFDFNSAPDDPSELQRWICRQFVEEIKVKLAQRFDFENTETLKAIFNLEIRDRAGAYKLLRSAGNGKYETKLAEDLLSWIDNPSVFARAVARHVGGERGINIIVAFDNVDRRDRESQLHIFQTAQWFKNLTKSFCIVSLRDTTFETYKSEAPLDTFVKASNFYIQPPRFVDMVRRRLDLAIESLVAEAESVLEYNIEGLGRVVYPKTNLGEYLNSIYTDLFRRKRKITMILEGLAGRSARRALEMFSAILKSGHLNSRHFTGSLLGRGEIRLHENQIICALMRTDYQYFFENHGFVHNIYDAVPGAKVKSHFLKFELLEFLIENRKRPGDARVEGFFSADFLIERLAKMGFPPQDTLEALRILLVQNLIVADHLNNTEVKGSDLLRVHASGFIHVRILAARVEYLAATALVTPLMDDQKAYKIGHAWHINDGHTDIAHKRKNELAIMFLEYLENQANLFRPTDATQRALFIGTSSALQRAREALGLESKSQDDRIIEPLIETFDRLFQSDDGLTANQAV